MMDRPSRIEELNRRFGVPELAKVIAGNGGMPKLSITAPASTAEIYLHGAQITSWRPAGADEVLFLSKHSHWENGRAIRGGIPVCFPWFRAKGDDARAPAHGFARTKEWQLDSVAAEDSGCTVSCSTESDASTQQWWPHDFRLVHRIHVGSSLRLQLTVANIGKTTFRFEEALHTYFRVIDARNAEILGLDGVAYLDNTDENRKEIQPEELILDGPTDRAYLDTQAAIEVSDRESCRAIKTEKENSATTIVWNPWQQGAGLLNDLGDDEWSQMICVEGGNILVSAVSLDPGEQHTMESRISVYPDRRSVEVR